MADLRGRVDLIQEATAIGLIKDACKPPWLVLKWLYIHDFNKQKIARLGAFDLERATEVMDFGQVHVFDIISRVVVPNLTAGPAYCQPLGHLYG